MAARRSPSPDTPAPQSIPLQNLSRPPDAAASVASHSRQNSRSHRLSRFSSGHGRTPSILARRQYQSLSTESPVDTRSSPPHESGSRYDTFSPEEAHAFASAQVGLSFEGPTISLDPPRPTSRLTTVSDERDLAGNPTENLNPVSLQDDDDLTPLTTSPGRRSAMKQHPETNSGQRHDRSKRNSVSFLNPGGPSTHSRSPQGSHLGDDLPALNTGVGGARRPSFERRSSDRSRSRSPSPSPLARAGSIFRGISERVVNISNDSGMVEQTIRRKSTVRRQNQSSSAKVDEDDVEVGPDTPGDQLQQSPPSKSEKPRPSISEPPPTFFHPGPVRYQNPLKGKTLGIFGPENPLRKWLLEILTHPATEPIILILIVAQTVLLAVNAASEADYMHAKSRVWGQSGFDYAIFGLFVVYTL